MIASMNYCGSILNTTGPFSTCIADSQVEQAFYYNQCELDLCALYDDYAVMKISACGHVENFVQTCEDRSHLVNAWREGLNCRAYWWNIRLVCITIALIVVIKCYNPVTHTRHSPQI